tara:strand:+ start:144 stop:854 length:711 start_codon:yes stop_codon:yes gene_type:complete
MPEDLRRREGTPGSANPNECYTCLGPVDHWHHVVPYSMGGDITLPLCNNCHGKIHDKDLMTMTALGTAVIKAKKNKGLAHGKPSKHSIEIIERIQQLVKEGLTNSEIAKIFIADGTWPMPSNFAGRWRKSPSNARAYWYSVTQNWQDRCNASVKAALRTGRYAEELAKNKSLYELSLKPEGERPAWMPDYEPVTRGSNVPSLFTETLQPAFDLKTTATPGTWNLSHWAWDAKQDTQ